MTCWVGLSDTPGALPRYCASCSASKDHEDITYVMGMVEGEVPLYGWTDLAQAFWDRYPLPVHPG